MKERPLFLMAVSCVLGEVLAAFSFKISFAAVAVPSAGLQLFFAAAFFTCDLFRRKAKGNRHDKKDLSPARGFHPADKNPGRRSWRYIILIALLLSGFWSGLVGYRNCLAEYAQDLSAYEGKTVHLSGTVTYAEERENSVYYYLKHVTVYAENNTETVLSGDLAGTGAETASEQEEETCGVLATYRKALVTDASTGTETENQSAAGSFLTLFSSEDAESGSPGTAYYVGKTVTLAVTYSAMNTAANPGNYDEADYYESKGIGLKAKLVAWESAEEGGFSVTNLLYRIRRMFHDRFYELTDEKTAAFYCGMLLGEGYEISSEDKDTFRTGGIGHILAISGLHISLIGMAIYRGLRLRFREGTATAAAIVFLALYGSLTGGSPSALRAIAMFALRILAKKCGRRFDFLSAAGFSACTILLEEPNYLFYSSFQLSYCAVFGAALAAPMVQKYLRTTGSLKNALLSGLTVQGFLLPVQLYYFYQIAPYSILINLIVIPSMGVMLGAGILGVGIGFLWTGAGGLLLGAGGKMLDFYAWLCEKTLALPGGLVITGAPSVLRIALFYGVLCILPAGMVWEKYREEKRGSERKRREKVRGAVKKAGKESRFRRRKRGCQTEESREERERLHLLTVRATEFRILFPRFRGKERRGKKIYEEKQLGPRLSFAKSLRRWCLFALVLTAAVFILTGKSRPGLKTVFLDVGQGNGIFFESAAGTTWLVDGGSSSITDVGTYRILPYLKWAGVQKIDYMVLTHTDSDHFSGLLEILDQAETGVGVGCLLVPDMSDLDEENYATVVETAEENGVPVYDLLAGVTWQEGGLNIACVWPDENADYTDTNEGSGVLYVTCGDFSMILTGDIGAATEAKLTESAWLSGLTGRLTVLGVPHHGSKYSSTEVFLAALSPRLAVISVGENTYGHPSEETLARLADCGAVTYTTLDCGAITITTDGEEVYFSCFSSPPVLK